MKNQIVIIGGGYSISNYHTLWNDLKKYNICTLGINFSYKDIIPTALVCYDYKFYEGKLEKTNGVFIKVNQQHVNELKELPLIIAPNRSKIRRVKYNNTILLDNYYFNSVTGTFALDIAVKIIKDNNFNGQIFLFGFDNGIIENSNDTHYYKHTQHHGIGNLTSYQPHTYPYKQFKGESDYIFNCSPLSTISEFPKLSYKEFLSKLIVNKHSQDELRNHIMKVLLHNV